MGLIKDNMCGKFVLVSGTVKISGMLVCFSKSFTLSSTMRLSTLILGGGGGRFCIPTPLSAYCLRTTIFFSCEIKIKSGCNNGRRSLQEMHPSRTNSSRRRRQVTSYVVARPPLGALPMGYLAIISPWLLTLGLRQRNFPSSP